MDKLYLEIQRQLEPFRDKVFYQGLNESEVKDIEQAIGKIFPLYFREFLKIFGVKQDFVFGLLTREIDFVENSRYLPVEVKASFILIGDNGGEDFWLLNTANQYDTDLYEWQHWADGKVVKLGYDFETLLKKSISKLSEPTFERKTDENKSWHVQFAIPSENEEKIYSTIPITLLEEWELKETSPAQVRCYETKVKLGDKVIKLKRQEYDGWSCPIYYFELREPAIELGQQSLIKDIDTKLKAAFPKYRLIEYGIIGNLQ